MKYLLIALLLIGSAKGQTKMEVRYDTIPVILICTDTALWDTKNGYDPINQVYSEVNGKPELANTYRLFAIDGYEVFKYYVYGPARVMDSVKYLDYHKYPVRYIVIMTK